MEEPASTKLLKTTTAADQAKLSVFDAYKARLHASVLASISGKMDESTKSKLEALRSEVPRYLFRAWNNTPGIAARISGGYTGLNTTDAITPLSFYNGLAPKSVYDMTQQACKIMAAQHVMGVAGFATGFSSWTPSLSFVLKFADNLSRQNRDGSANHVHISVIDTKELWTSIQIFHVPALATALATGLGPYPEEYLAYGVIKGRWHKAVPLMVFREAGLPLQPALTVPPKDVCGPVETERASAIAKEFGPDFALPVYLAVLTKAGPVLGLDHVNFGRLLSAIQPVDVPVKKWAKDTGVKPYMHHIDVVQFCGLMQTLAEKLNDSNASGNAINPRAENNLPNKKRARVDEPATNKRIRIEVSANDQKPQLTTTFKTLAFDDDDDMDDDFSESESKPEPALKKTRYTATSTTAAPAPKKPFKTALKKSTKTYGVTTRRMGKEGKALFKGPGVSTRRASRVMEREMKKLSIDMKD